MAGQNPLRVDPIAEARRQWHVHGWDDAAAGMTAVTSVMRAQQLMQASVDAALKPHKLTFARYEMLRMLAFTRAGRLPLASAIDRLQVHPTSVTNTVERLVKDGYIERVKHPSDGRAALLLLTESGRAVVEDATVSLNTEVFERVGMIHADTTALVAIVARFREGAGDFVNDPESTREPD